MSKKLESNKEGFAGIRRNVLILLALMLLSTLYTSAQNEELKQKLEAFKNEHSENYELKFLNISDRDLGMIDDTFPAFTDKFMLKSKEKVVDNLGNKGYAKFYFNVYSYETLTDRQYALKDWMEKFLEGRSVRAGRDMRTYEYATPTIILISDTEIIICNFKCSDYTEDNFEFWEDELLKYFGEDNTMEIEVLCGGPLKWTKNAPDPKNARGLF